MLQPMENYRPPFAGPEAPTRPAPLSFSTAVVHAGGMEIPYLRAGRGPSVLLLADPVPEIRETGEGGRAADTGSGPAGGPELQALAGSFRVIIPLLPPPRTAREGGRWIRDVIDGLGLDRPALLAPMDLAPLLLRVARRDPARVGLCVLVPSPSRDPDSGFDPAATSILRALQALRTRP